MKPQERASQEEYHSRFELRTIIDTSRLLIESYDEEFILNNLLLITMGKLMVSKAQILVYHPDKKQYELSHFKGRSSLGKGRFITLPWKDESKEESYICCDQASKYECPQVFVEDDITVFFNLRTSNHHIGFLALGPKLNKEPLSEGEVEFIESLAIISAVAIGNSRLFRELRKTNRQLDRKVYELNTLFDLSKDFNMMVEFDQIARVFKFAMLGQLLIRSYFFLLDHQEQRQMVDSNHIKNSPTEEEIDALFDLNEDVVRVDDELREKIPFLKTNKIEAIVSLRFQDQRLAIVGVGPRANKEAYHESDLNFLSSLGNLALLAIQKTFLLRERIEKERIEEELNIAKTIQQGLLPDPLPEIPYLDIAASNISSYQVGGDYYDLIPADVEGDYYLAIADVTGKGIPASLLMANLQSMLHTLAPLEVTMPEATGRINDLIYNNTPSDKFITFFWTRITDGGKTLNYVNAGHNPPILFRKGEEEPETMEEGGLILGAMPSMMPYEEEKLALSSEDLIVFYTDGVTEAQNGEEEEYGEERLAEAIKKNRNLSAREIMNAIIDEVNAFSRPKQFDDITMIVMKGK